MDKRFCQLSEIDYSKSRNPKKLEDIIKGEKFLERPFAYEFFHQFRKLIEAKKVDLGDTFIQPEVDKNYQHCLGKNGRIPDFIIHLPNSKQNLAIIEFKRATNLQKNAL